MNKLKINVYNMITSFSFILILILIFNMNSKLGRDYYINYICLFSLCILQISLILIPKNEEFHIGKYLTCDKVKRLKLITKSCSALGMIITLVCMYNEFIGFIVPKYDKPLLSVLCPVYESNKQLTNICLFLSLILFIIILLIKSHDTEKKVISNENSEK